MGLEGELCAIVSNTGGGLTWYRDPLERRITRYIQIGSNKDRPGRWVFLRDVDSGEYWSPTFQPTTHVELDSYECRHGLGYTQISSSYLDVAAEVLQFIPLGENIEVQRVLLRNEGGRARELSVFTYREFVNDSGLQDLTNIQYSGHLARVDFDENDETIFYLMTVQQAGHRPLPFFTVSEPIVGFDTKCETFIGRGSIETPEVVKTGRTTNSIAGDATAIGVFQMNVALEPGEEKVLHFILGVADDRPQAREIIGRWRGNDEKVIAALTELKEHAVGLIGAFQCEVPDAHVSVMVNTWNAYQCWINFQFSRSISGHATGLRRSMGTRDSLQDLLGYMHMAPDSARTRIIELIRAVQLEDGSCQHQYSALTQEGSGQTGFSDDHLWAILAVSAYVKETGDTGILDEQFSYSDNRNLTEDLYHHLLRAVQYSFNDRGAHGIPRLRSADWNDTIGDGPNDEVSESVLVGIMLVEMADLMAHLTERSGRAGLAAAHEGRDMPVLDYLREVSRTMAAAVNEAAWLPEGYYARGTDRHGEWFGVPSRDEAKIFLEPQPWSVMAGVADAERGRAAMDSVRDHLFTPYGIQLLTPACSVAPSGNFHVFPKCAKENGGIFCHPNPWAVCAECLLGRGDRALEYYKATLPAAASEPDPEHYSAEPYVYGQIRYGREHVEYGKCSGTWLTGTAAWNYVAASQYILGVRPEWDGLLIDPCVPPDWKEFSIVRRFRGATYRISVSNPDGVCKGLKECTLDGQLVDGNIVPVCGEGAHEVNVVMG
jgi:cellobiose phosphorylase